MQKKLKIHIHTVHEGRKYYNCDSCEKYFTEKSALKRHHVVHEGHKDYKCESCNKPFSRADHLKTHIHTVHEGHKDYKCGSCGKSFSDAFKNNMNSCTKCKTHFKSMADFRNHVHDEGNCYKCGHCQSYYRNFQDLSSHQKLIHAGQRPLFYKMASKKEIFKEIPTEEKQEDIMDDNLENGEEFPDPASNDRKIREIHSDEKSKISNNRNVDLGANNKLLDHQIFSSPPNNVAYIKNQNYVRKRKPIDFTIDDIAADAEGIDDKTIISNFQFDEKMTKRSLPKRNCKDKNILYNNPEEDQKSSEDEIVSEDPNNSIDENVKPDQIEMFNDKNVYLVSEEESKLKNLTEKNTSNTNNQHLCKEKNCIKLVTGRRNLINHYKIAHRLSKKIIGKPLKSIPSSLLKY